MAEPADMGLGRSISIGALWMLGLRLSIKSLGLISSVILARLLMPEDFGMVALAMSVYALIRLIRQFGFGFALIQNQSATKSYYDTAWTLQVLLSTAAAVILLGLGPWAASFYEDPRLLPIFTVLALMFFITGFESIGVIDFQKKMTFDRVFLVQVIPKIVSFISTICLAFWLRSYWALVLGMLINKLALLIVGYVMHEYRPKFSLQAWRQLVGFSSWLLVNNVIKYLNRHGQNILLAKFGGAPLVGIVSVATEFASFVATEVVQPVNTAAYPGFSRVSQEKKKLTKTVSGVVEVVAFTAMPGAAGIAALAPLFVPVLLGHQWLEAVGVIPLIAYASILISLMTTYDMAFTAIARQRVTTYLVVLRVVIFFPLMYLLYKSSGATGVAVAVLVSNLVVFPLYLLALRRNLDYALVDMFQMMIRPFLAAVTMHLVIAIYIDQFGLMDLSIGGLLLLVSAVLIGAAIFILCALILWRIAGAPYGIEQRAIDIARQRIRSICSSREQLGS